MGLQVWLILPALFIVSSLAMATVSRPRPSLALHWFRHTDLRLHDNPALVESHRRFDYVLPIFCFDSSNIFGTTSKFGNSKCGSKRAKFILESVADLRSNLESKGSKLLVAHGEPGKVFDDILSKVDCKAFDVNVVVQEEVVKEELDQVRCIRRILKNYQGTIHSVWGSTMYEKSDLPFEEDLSDMPDVFTPFRNKTEKKSQIRKPLPIPTLTLPESSVYKDLVDLASYLPNLKELGYDDEQIEFANSHDQRGVMEFKGGETAALARVKDYIWTKDLLKDYFDTRNGMIGADYSTKLSPWLAHGCVSPRLVASECSKYEAERVQNKSTYWVVFEMLWRDFCKFFAYKHGDSIFFPGGTINSDKRWKLYEPSLTAWKDGKTGYPLVDANMREMKATGFMSNRGRQNVASFLVNDLCQDWRYGGDYFESQLLDYDVYSNWVNWVAAAGMTGGRLNRFNIVKQSKDYDQHGDYVRRWLPELTNVPAEFIHEPWKMTQFQQTEYNVRLGVDYPNPIVSFSSRPQTRKDGKQNKQRRQNTNSRNRHQKYEMKSLKTGKINMN